METKKKPGGLSKGDKRPWVAGRKATGLKPTKIKNFKLSKEEFEEVNEILKSTNLKMKEAFLKILRDYKNKTN